MSIRAPSVVGLVGYLQTQGLTYAMLRELVRAVRDRHTGEITLRLSHGRIRTVEIQPPARPRRRFVADET
jgi:hypothetical protein